jgi:diaminopimelate decarboxylase
MSFSRDSAGVAHLGGVSLQRLLVEGQATPAYVYDVDAMVAEATALGQGFGGREHLVCYAVKANTAGRILRRFAAAGVGADIVSVGELRVALGAGIPASRIVWSGVAKRDDELDAALAAGVRSLHAESVEELARIEARARAAGVVAPVSLRVNPSVEADTHAHIATGHDEAKFGVRLGAVPAAIERVLGSDALRLVGLSAHVGSQMLEPRAYVAGVDVLADLVSGLAGRGVALELLDIGGGFGVDYGRGTPVPPAAFIRQACERLDARRLPPMQLLCEPGRSLVAAHGVLVARVLQTKAQPGVGYAGWLLIDGAMNDLLRPALYGAHHRIEPVRLTDAPASTWKVGGPVCESSDDFGRHDLAEGVDAVVVRDAGAYGYTMASRYNGRAMPAEVFLEGGRVSAVSRVDDVDSWVAGRLAT